MNLSTIFDDTGRCIGCSGIRREPEEFSSWVDSSMEEIISEAQKVHEVLGTGKMSVVHG